MAEEGAHGGKIVVRSDGLGVWQSASREFPAEEDMSGTLEYAIRVVKPNGNVVAPKDGMRIR